MEKAEEARVEAMNATMEGSLDIAGLRAESSEFSVQLQLFQSQVNRQINENQAVYAEHAQRTEERLKQEFQHRLAENNAEWSRRCGEEAVEMSRGTSQEEALAGLLRGRGVARSSDCIRLSHSACLI